MYKGIGPMAGTIVEDEDAMEYALEQCGVVVDARAPFAGEFLDMMVDWFFSGNFCHYEDDDPEICQSAPEEDGPDPDEEYERYLDIIMEEQTQ